ncbi:MAG TPA: tyrosine-type recombinase/integrase [Candidatus Gastranaerophilales bacterium]|nr:tyrosine-type recombinase/integrase [Candidatus Gastranaerophilales bacterium]
MPVYQSKTGKWYISLMVRGKRYHRAVPEATSRKDAEKAETIIKAELLQGKYNLVEGIGEMPFMKLLEVYNEYAQTAKLSWKKEAGKINKLTEFFQGYKIGDISPSLIEKYRASRKNTPKKNSKPLSNATINREIAILSKMLSIAVKNGWLAINPCRCIKKLREDTKMERFLQREEEEKLLYFCTGTQEYMKPILVCALHTGMRRGEIFNLKWGNVNLQEGFITVTKTKSGKDRKIPISSTLKSYFEELIKKQVNEYVFPSPITGKPYNTIRKGFELLCKKAGIKNLRFHDLRHTAATRMVALGVELVIVQDILGHANITTTMRYAHPVPERKKMAIEALAKF